MNTDQTIKALNGFSQNVTREDFLFIFGNIGPHLWDKFNLKNCDVIYFYMLLDLDNRRKMVSHLYAISKG